MFNRINIIMEKLLRKLFYLLDLKKYNFFNNYIDIICNKKERIPIEIVKKMSKGIRKNNRFLPGKKIKIKLNGNSLDLRIIYKNRIFLKHMSNVATSGIDIYDFKKGKYIWIENICPTNNLSMISEKKINLEDGLHELYFYLPSFSEVKSIYVKRNYSNIEMVKDNNEILIYGSSITQGCAASRSGLTYCNLLSRLLNKDILNYGFSESAKGEREVIEFLASKHMSIYILEYDHNSDISELEKNHKNMYRIIRSKNKNSIIILLSRFSGGLSISKDEEKARLEIISKTYKEAIDNGDKKIFFVDGSNIIKDNKDNYFVDGTHPNDRGMSLIADEIIKIIEKEEIYEN